MIHATIIDWKQVEIAFVEKNIVDISIYDYELMTKTNSIFAFDKMYKRSSKKITPTIHWYFLMLLSVYGGVISKQNMIDFFYKKNWEAIRKLKSDTCKVLKKIFNLNDNPIVFDRLSGKYFSKIKLSNHGLDVRTYLIELINEGKI